MSQSLLLIKVLKQALKAQNLTYKEVAKHLGLSEASVKRMFANAQLSLERIDAICELIGIEISDLLLQMQNLYKRITRLTYEQEKKIVSDRKLCLVTVCVVNHWSLEEILDFYSLSKNECIRYLAELDKLKLIELLPNNKVKLLISSGFNWIPNGPIQTFIQKYILTDYIDSNFQNENEEMLCQFGMLTMESSALLRKKIHHLVHEFVTMCQQDASEPMKKRFGTALVLMTRPWATTIFNEFIKTQVRSINK